METLDNQSFNEKGDGNVTQNSYDILRRTIPWMKFIAIMGFIFTGGYVIRGLMAGASSHRDAVPEMLGMLIGAVIILFPNIFLFQYASNLAYFVESKQPFDLETALAKQRTFYLYTGILLIIAISIIVIGLVFLAGLRIR